MCGSGGILILNKSKIHKYKYGNPPKSNCSKTYLQPAQSQVYKNTAATDHFHSHQNCQTGNTWRNRECGQRILGVINFGVSQTPPPYVINCNHFDYSMIFG